HHAHQTQLFTELGYSFQVRQGLSLQPYARADWNQLNNAGFTEKGGAAALRSGADTNSVTSLTLGLRGQGQIELTDKTAYISAELGWRNSQGDLSPTRKLQFAQATNTQFTVSGAPLARNALLTGLDARVEIGKNAVAGLAYKGQFGDGNTSNSA